MYSNNFVSKIIILTIIYKQYIAKNGPLVVSFRMSSSSDLFLFPFLVFSPSDLSLFPLLDVFEEADPLLRTKMRKNVYH